jgi:hypothetical protein
VPQEPELLDLWKAAWDCLIWKAMIPKVKAIEGELNRNPPGFSQGRSQRTTRLVVTMLEGNAPCSNERLDAFPKPGSI